MGMDIKPINYAEEYHVMKPSLFRESENLDRLLQALFDVCDVQQKDFLWLAENLLNLDVAQGFHLDFIGSIVGQPRFLTDFNTEPYFGYEGSYQSKTFGSSLDPEVGGYWNSRSYFNTATSRQLNDDEYRRLIKARAIYNQSNCTTNDLLEVVNLITDRDDNTVQLLSHGLINIRSDDDTGILSYFVDRLYSDDNILPIAAGVRVGLEDLSISFFIVSSPYPLEENNVEDSFSSKIEPVSLKLRESLKSRFEQDSFQTQITPISLSIRDSLMKSSQGGEGISTSISPISVSKQSLLKKYTHKDYDGVKTSIEPISLELAEILVNQVVDEKDAIVTTIKPISISKGK